MARPTRIAYWATRKGGGYFCIYKGERFELALGPDDQPVGPTYRAAQDKFQAIMEGKKEEEKRQREPAPRTVREVLEAYLVFISKKRKDGTLQMRFQTLQPLADHPIKGGCLGEVQAEKLTAIDVYAFLDHMETVPRFSRRKKHQPGRKPTTWGPTTQRNCVVGLIAAFNWAVKGGMIQKNPVAGIERPAGSSRGAESLIGTTPEEVEQNHQRIMSIVRPHWKPFIQALKDTGARPSEIAAVKAEDFRPDMGAFLFHKQVSRKGDRFSHKTAKVKDRVIFLTGPTLDTVKELVKKLPRGPLFRRKNNKAFDRVTIVGRFVKLQKRLQMPALTAYSYRHTFATDMLKAGMDVDSLAELMGNSPNVIRLHYSHLLADTKGLRAKLERFKTVAGNGNPPDEVSPAPPSPLRLASCWRMAQTRHWLQWTGGTAAPVACRFQTENRGSVGRPDMG